jgi:hypothetical protein
MRPQTSQVRQRPRGNSGWHGGLVWSSATAFRQSVFNNGTGKASTLLFAWPRPTGGRYVPFPTLAQYEIWIEWAMGITGCFLLTLAACLAQHALSIQVQRQPGWEVTGPSSLFLEFGSLRVGHWHSPSPSLIIDAIHGWILPSAHKPRRVVPVVIGAVASSSRRPLFAIHTGHWLSHLPHPPARASLIFFAGRPHPPRTPSGPSPRSLSPALCPALSCPALASNASLWPVPAARPQRGPWNPCREMHARCIQQTSSLTYICRSGQTLPSSTACLPSCTSDFISPPSHRSDSGCIWRQHCSSLPFCHW